MSRQLMRSSLKLDKAQFKFSQQIEWKRQYIERRSD